MPPNRGARAHGFRAHGCLGAFDRGSSNTRPDGRCRACSHGAGRKHSVRILTSSAPGATFSHFGTALTKRQEVKVGVVSDANGGWRPVAVAVAAVRGTRCCPYGCGDLVPRTSRRSARVSDSSHVQRGRVKRGRRRLSFDTVFFPRGQRRAGGQTSALPAPQARNVAIARSGGGRGAREWQPSWAARGNEGRGGCVFFSLFFWWSKKTRRRAYFARQSSASEGGEQRKSSRRS